MKQIENENMKVTYTEEGIKNLMRKLAENESKYSHKEVKADLQEQMKQLEKRIADLERQVQRQLLDVKNQPQTHQGTIGIGYSCLGVGLQTETKGSRSIFSGLITK